MFEHLDANNTDVFTVKIHKVYVLKLQINDLHKTHTYTSVQISATILTLSLCKLISSALEITQLLLHLLLGI